MDERELDGWIDAGLASYPPEMPAGLEARIVSLCSATPALSTKRTAAQAWLRAGAAIAAAGLLAAFFVHHERPGSTSSPEAMLQRPAQIQPVIAVTSGEPGIRLRKVGAKVRYSSGAGRVSSQVYEPSPLTEQELMLAELAREHPQQLLAITAMSERQSEPLKVEPLSVATLEIAPIKIDPISGHDSE